MASNENKITFLITAISDTQELIRFTDTKTAIIITILGAYIIALFTVAEKIVKYLCWYSDLFWLSISLFILLLILCIVVTTRIIKPTNNPIENINIENSNQPNLKFFLTPNDYLKDDFYLFYNSKKFKLKEIFSTYLQQLNASTEDDIIKSLTLELFKVSYIRNIKNDRFNILLWLLIGTTISFFVAYFIFITETRQIIDYFGMIGHTCIKNK